MRKYENFRKSHCKQGCFSSNSRYFSFFEMVLFKTYESIQWENTSEYDFVLKKFSKTNELVVSEATTINTTDKVFTSEVLKDWPHWTKPLTSIFVGRSVTLEIPVTTEFKLNLSNITSKDVTIKHDIISFNTP